MYRRRHSTHHHTSTQTLTFIPVPSCDTWIFIPTYTEILGYHLNGCFSPVMSLCNHEDGGNNYFIMLKSPVWLPIDNLLKINNDNLEDWIFTISVSLCTHTNKGMLKQPSSSVGIRFVSMAYTTDVSLHP